jgi:hypothetical protein
MTYAIEHDIPVPLPRVELSTVYPFSKLTKIGLSFFVPNNGPVAGLVLQRRVASRAVHHAKARGWKFATRQVDGGVRVWRVK